MDLKIELANERTALREEILSVGAILSAHEKHQIELTTLTAEYQSCEDLEEKATIAMRVMDLRIAIDDEGFDAADLEARIDVAFDEYDNALMDALIASEPQPPAPAPAPQTSPQISPVVITNGTQAVERTAPPRSAFPPITNKCPLCDGYKRAEFDYCRNCYMQRNPNEFDTCSRGRTKHVRYEMCGACYHEEQNRFA